jgi:hypothetical protein
MAKTTAITITIGDRTYSELVEGGIQPSKLTPDEVKNALNRAVGKRAFYSALRADAKKHQSKVEAEFELWHAQKFNMISKLPEYKKAAQKVVDVQIIIQFPKQYQELQRRQREIAYICEKLLVLVNAFADLLSAMQSIGKLTLAELEMYSRGAGASGSGDFAED